MNIKASLRYQLNEHKRPIIIYYFVLLSLIGLIGISVVIPDQSGSSSFNGIEFSTVIFLFILGLNSFKEAFGMFIQNGLSRKTLFLGRNLSLLAISAIMAIIDIFILVIGKAIASVNDHLQVMSLYEMGYKQHGNATTSLQLYVESFIFQFSMYLAFAAIGYFITIGYYRMNKSAKIAVSISVPVTIWIILPLIDSILTEGRIFHFLSDLINFAFGLKSGNPYQAIITFILLFAAFDGLSWLLLRKAVDKN